MCHTLPWGSSPGMRTRPRVATEKTPSISSSGPRSRRSRMKMIDLLGWRGTPDGPAAPGPEKVPVVWSNLID